MEFPFALWIDKTYILDDIALVLDFRERETKKEVENERKKQEKAKHVSPKKRLSMYKQDTTLDSFFKKSLTSNIVKTNISNDIKKVENMKPQLNSVKKQLFVGNDEQLLEKPPVLVREESNGSVKRKPEDHDKDDTDDESLIILEELSVPPVTPKQDAIFKASPTKKHRIDMKILPLMTNNIKAKQGEDISMRSRIPRPAINYDKEDELFKPTKRSTSIPPDLRNRTLTPKKRISTRSTATHSKINYNMPEELFNYNSSTKTLHTPAIPTPKKPPYLARTDTFGSSEFRRNILDDINNDVEQVVRVMNNTDSDSTLATLSDDETPVNNRSRDNSEDPFNESDDILLDL